MRELELISVLERALRHANNRQSEEAIEALRCISFPLPTLRNLQDNEWNKYHETSTARGVQGNFIRLVEEVGEVAKALRDVQATASPEARQRLQSEMADVQAWLLTLASITKIDLEDAYLAKYGMVDCFRCQKHPCECPEKSVSA